MGIRGVDELLAVLPPAAAAPVTAVLEGLADLQSLRHSALAPEDVRALGEVWERLAAQVASGRLGLLTAIDARSDVIPKARVGEAGAVFAIHTLGQRSAAARRDAAWGSLLRPDGGDLPALGVAFAAGDISTGHVEVAVRAHHRLGQVVRERPMGCQVPDGDDDVTAALRAALADLTGAFTAQVRLILVVDAVLAHYARSLTVPELDAIATRIVATVNPPNPKGTHERRGLRMDQLPDGSWTGRFSCGAEQGLRLKRAIEAWSAPRPGKGIDQDGVAFDIPDPRDAGARRMDAVTDIVNVALAKTGITLPSEPDTEPSPANARTAGDQQAARVRADESDGDDGSWHAGDLDGEPLDAPPAGEGQTVVLREPGALLAPYPDADLIVVAGIEHVAVAWAHSRDGGDGATGNRQESFAAWLRDRYTPPEKSRHEQPGLAPPGEFPRPDDDTRPQNGDCGQKPQGHHDEDAGTEASIKQDWGELAWLSRALSPYAVPARVEHSGLVDPTTLELLACNGTVRAAVLAPNGALLNLGRSQRLASAPQKSALLARDGGCVIAGCTVPGDACDAHHVEWWTRGGRTDLDNLALVCGRHHAEVHLGTWQIQMLDGIPWIRPPKWMAGGRLLRNAAHHPEQHRRDEAA